jgi:hypothetical protein
MSDVKGIHFINGMQVIAKVVREDDYYIHVEDMLSLQLMQKQGADGAPLVGEDGQPIPFLYLSEEFTPYTDIEKTGLNTKIPRSAVFFFFDPKADILSGYNNRTSRIQIAPASLASTLRTK